MGGPATRGSQPHQAPAPAPAPLPAPTPAPAPAVYKYNGDLIQRDVINRHALDNIRALSKDRGEALVHRVIAAYVDDTPQHLRTLLAYCNSPQLGAPSPLQN